MIAHLGLIPTITSVGGMDEPLLAILSDPRQNLIDHGHGVLIQVDVTSERQNKGFRTCVSAAMRGSIISKT
jgi:hypothetical protein